MIFCFAIVHPGDGDALAGEACEHDPCYQGDALQNLCSPCVTAICEADASCCSDNWDLGCALATDDLCARCEPLCGDATEDRRVTAPDALQALRTAVGSGDCPTYLCDFNGDGDVLAVDALLILRVAVGISANANCPAGPALYQYVVSELFLPQDQDQAEDFGFNIDDDVHGGKDNQLGFVLMALAMQGFNLQETVDLAIQSGELVELASLLAADLTTDVDATWQFHAGEPEELPPVFDGTDAFEVAESGVVACDPTSESYLNIFDEEPHDGHISIDEVRENSFVQTLFAPDVSVIDESDAYVPNPDGDPDALSFAFGFHCVPATFDE